MENKIQKDLTRIDEFITNTIANGIQEDVCLLQNGIVLLANMVGKKLTFVMYDRNMSIETPFTADSSSVSEEVQWQYKEWYYLVIQDAVYDKKEFCLPGEHKMLFGIFKDQFTDGNFTITCNDNTDTEEDVEFIVDYYQQKEGEKKYWL